MYISTPPSSEVENLLPCHGSNHGPAEPEADMLPSEPARRALYLNIIIFYLHSFPYRLLSPTDGRQGHEVSGNNSCVFCLYLFFLIGLQQGYTKFCCFLCLSGSCAGPLHYKTKDWPKRQSLEPGSHNDMYKQLVEFKNIILPALHIKLGLMKNFVKVMDISGKNFSICARNFHVLVRRK